MADLLGGSSAGNPALDQMMQTRAAGLAGRADAPRRSRLPQLNLDLDQPVGDAAAPASAQVVPEEQPAAATPVQAPQVESTDSGADQPVKEFLMELLARRLSGWRVSLPLLRRRRRPLPPPILPRRPSPRQRRMPF